MGGDLRKSLLHWVLRIQKMSLRGGTTKQSRSYTDRICIGYEIATPSLAMTWLPISL